MPSFDARGRELRESLTALQPQLDIAEYTRMTAAVNDYLAARDAVLTMIQLTIADDHPEPLTQEYASKLRDMTRAATDRLDNMLSGLSNPSAAAVRWREQLSFAEFIFWGSVGGLKLAEARDDMVVMGNRVREMIAVLDKRWQNLSEEDLRVEQAEQQATQDLKDALERALAQAMPYWLQAFVGATALREGWKTIFKEITDHVKEALVGAGAPRDLVDKLLKLASWANDAAEFLELAKKAGVDIDTVMTWLNRIRSMNVGGLVQYRVGTLVDSQTKTVVSALGEAGKVIKPFAEELYDRHMSRYKAQLDNEGLIIVSFGGIRQMVDQFLKDCNLDGLRSTHADVLAAMDRIVSQLPTDGMKLDWGAVRNALKDAFDARRNAAEGAFGQFYMANDGRFLGGLSSDTERALLENDKWVATTNAIVNVGMDTKLREWREKVTVVQAAPQDAFDQIQDAFLGLPLDIRDQVKSSINDYLRKQIETLNGEADQAIATIEKCKLMVNAQKISDDMDRSRLQQALRATIR